MTKKAANQVSSAFVIAAFPPAKSVCVTRYLHSAKHSYPISAPKNVKHALKNLRNIFLPPFFDIS